MLFFALQMSAILPSYCGSLPQSLFPKEGIDSYMTSRRSKLQEDTYFRVLRILQERPDVTQREIAHLLGVSTSGMNYCLNALIDKGWVKVHNFSESKNKFGYVYLITPSGFAEKTALTSRFLQRKLKEYEEMRAEIDSIRSEVSEVSRLANNILASRI